MSVAFTSPEGGNTNNHSSDRQTFLSNVSTSKPYFLSLLNTLSPASSPSQNTSAIELLSGYVGSADTGSEDLVRASRAALVNFCDMCPENAELICATLLTILKTNITNDRILVPTLEVIGFLFDAHIYQNSSVE